MDYEQILREFSTTATTVESTVRKVFSEKINYQTAPGGSGPSGLGLIYVVVDSPLESLADSFVEVVKAAAGERRVFFCDDLPRVFEKMVDGKFSTIAFIRGSWV